MKDPRYPIGPAPVLNSLSDQERTEFIQQISELPIKLKEAVSGLTDQQLDTPYREGGWTVRQVVHHVADSHINAYVRLKLVLTEDQPTIKPYAEALWAELPDSCLEITSSLSLLEGLHIRWVHLFQQLSAEQWKLAYLHPELQVADDQQGDWAKAFQADEAGRVSLEGVLVTYAWHGRHHTAHITELREEKGW